MTINQENASVAVNMTLYSAYQPIERYRSLFERVSPVAFIPQIVLRAMDVYLIRLLAQLNDVPLTLVDLAAETTWGASVILGLTDPHIRHVITTRPLSPPAQTNWRHAFELASQEMGLELSALTSDIVIESPTDWNNVLRLINPLTQPMLLISGSEDDPQRVIDYLEVIFQHQPNTLCVIAPLGLIGQSILLKDLIIYCSATHKQLVALRELSSFLSSSQLALLYSPDNNVIPTTLTRIQQLYAGNFHFLDQVKAITQTASASRDAEISKLRTELSSINWIYSSKAWKMINRYYTLRQKLISWLKRY